MSIHPTARALAVDKPPKMPKQINVREEGLDRDTTHEGGEEEMSEGGGQGSFSGHDGGAGEGMSEGERQGGLSSHEGGAGEGTSEGATPTRVKVDRLLLGEGMSKGERQGGLSGHKGGGGEGTSEGPLGTLGKEARASKRRRAREASAIVRPRTDTRQVKRSTATMGAVGAH